MTVYMGMKYRDVAEAADPLGLLHKFTEVETVDNAYRTITATSAKDGFHLGVVQHGLKVLGSFAFGTAKLVVFSIKVFSLKYFEAFFGEPLDGGLHFFFRNLAGGSHNADGVACLQKGR